MRANFLMLKAKEITITKKNNNIVLVLYSKIKFGIRSLLSF